MFVLIIVASFIDVVVLLSAMLNVISVALLSVKVGKRKASEPEVLLCDVHTARFMGNELLVF